MRKMPVWRCDEAGASAAEYALFIAFVAAVIVIAVSAFGVTTSGLFDEPCDELVAAGRTC